MFPTRKLAASVKYIVGLLGALFYNGEKKKIMSLKEVDL